MSSSFVVMYVLYICVCVLYYNKMLQKTSSEVSWKEDKGGQNLETGDGHDSTGKGREWGPWNRDRERTRGWRRT